MNQGLIQDVKNDVELYLSEIEELKVEIKRKQSVIETRIQDLKPFLPFKCDDIVFNGSSMFKITSDGKIENVSEDGKVYIEYSFRSQNSYTGFQTNPQKTSMPLENWLSYKKIN